MLAPTTLTLLLLLLTAQPASAAWETQQSTGFAQARYTDKHYQLTLSCQNSHSNTLNNTLSNNRSNDTINTLTLTLNATAGNSAQLNGIASLMVWLTLPDGRTDRWPVEVTHEGTQLTGTALVSDFSLYFFQHGQRFQLEAPVARVEFLEGDMMGTGAARLAFKEQCGF
tara:strand:+ start:745 stop:1251 length:507 start_codon:yes stop_codon:yes gene_type:complete